MKLKFGPEIILSYKRLAYHAWYALAEFVDNSTQAYINNHVALDHVYQQEKSKLSVEISTGRDNDGDYIIIEDNSIGMSQRELANAVFIGKPPLDTRGRSRYGLGLKTGASWFGDFWSVDSKKLGERFRHKITVDVPKVARGKLTLPLHKVEAPASEHGTKITIRKLHRKLTGRTLGKVKEYLRSLYRRDISKGILVLKVNGEILTWDNNIDARLLKLKDDSLAKVDIRFRVGRRIVTGWAGVLETGSRKSAGFSVIQNDRVITGWPDSYRPETVFGPQEGGSNDLVNQRLFGELVLDGFDVSHTKDQILFADNEQEILEAKLGEALAGLRQLALSYRKFSDERVRAGARDARDEALNTLEEEIKRARFGAFLSTFEVPNARLIRKTNNAVMQAVVKKTQPSIRARLGSVEVLLYVATDMSPNDPYLIIESTSSTTKVLVLVNSSHPHWAELKEPTSVLNFLRHCTYDGVAEWKAYRATHSLQPDTIKLIKDNLLRLSLEMANDGA